MNVMSRVFFKDFYAALPGFSFFRMTTDGLAPMGPYQPRTHELFINAYLVSKGAQPVNLDRFKTLKGSQAKGANRHRRWMTNLKELNVDTSWYTRYRSTKNPDFGAKFPQAVTISNQPAIPLNDRDTPPHQHQPVPPKTRHQKRMQAIANSAGFHFAMIEQGGSSLYTTLALQVSNVEVLRIVVSIGGVEVNHFAVWHDPHPKPSYLFALVG